MMAKHEKRGPKARVSRGGVECARGVTLFRARRDEKRGGNAAPWKAWKTPKRVSPSFHRAWKSGQKQRRRIPHISTAPTAEYIFVWEGEMKNQSRDRISVDRSRPSQAG